MRIEIRLAPWGGLAVGLLLLCLAGCPARPHGPDSGAATQVGAAHGTGTAGPEAGSPAAGDASQVAHEGHPYDVASRESLLTILAFRGGALSKVGHNHVIASHDLSGTFYVPDDVSRSTFELHMPVEQLTIDEADLRVKEGPDFPPDVPDSAKEGTRRNMLSEALLNGAQYPEITLVGQQGVAVGSADARTGASSPAGAAQGRADMQAHADVQITVRGQTHTVSVPVVYSL